MEGLISLLIYLVIFGVVVWLVYYVLGLLPLPEPIRTIVVVVLGLILLVYLLNMLGFLGGLNLRPGR